MVTKKKKGTLCLIILAVLLFVVVVVSFCLGRYPVPLRDLGRILSFSAGLPIEKTWTNAM